MWPLPSQLQGQPQSDQLDASVPRAAYIYKQVIKNVSKKWVSDQVHVNKISRYTDDQENSTVCTVKYNQVVSASCIEVLNGI